MRLWKSRKSKATKEEELKNYCTEVLQFLEKRKIDWNHSAIVAKVVFPPLLHADYEIDIRKLMTEFKEFLIG